MTNKTVTIKQLAELLGEDVVYVTGFVKVLVSQGVIKEVGKAPKAEGERGRASTIYQVPNEAVLVFWDSEEKNETEIVPAAPVEIVENKVDTAPEIG